MSQFVAACRNKMTSLIIRAMTLDDVAEIENFLRNHFFGHEPLTQTPGPWPPMIDEPHLQEQRESVIREGASLVAIEGNRIVGMALAGSMLPSTVEQNWLEATENRQRTELSEHIHHFLAGIERSAHIFEHFGVSDSLYVHIIAVDSTERRQGLGRRLVLSLMDVGRAKGFPILVATCTSLYSTRLMASVGFECVHSQAYADHKNEDGDCLLKPPAPHTKASVMAITL